MVAASLTPSVARGSLCVGMATHGEYDGVWFTIQAIRMYHAEVLEDLSFVVIDNDPEGATAPALREIDANHWARVRRARPGADPHS